MIIRQSHNLDIRQRRPHVTFEHRPRRDHVYIHLKRRMIPIRKFLALVAVLLQVPTCSCPSAGGTHRIRVKASYDDRCRSVILHRDSALASRRRYPTHRCRVALKPTRRRESPRFPGSGYLHGPGCGLGGRAEGRTGAVRGGYVIEERTTMLDECKWTRLGEPGESDLPSAYLYVFDQYYAELASRS